METTAAIVAISLLVVIAAFQLALAAGAPLGAAAWSGRHAGTLPTGLRVASGVAGVVVYPLLIALVLASTGLIETQVMGAGSAAMWVLTGFFALGTVANAVSPSRVERIWAPVSLLLAISCAVIATRL